LNFPNWSATFGFVIGAVIGSFLNMVIHRLPRKISFINPSKSFCPKCEHPLEAVDLVPLLSWLSTGGKCRYCKEPVAVRYFLVELLTAALFTALWYQFLVATYAPLKCGFYALETAGLVGVIFIDWELYIIPDELNAYLLIVPVIYRLIDRSFLVGLEGGLLGWGLLWGIAFLGRIAFRKDAMGHGDIKMMRGVGFLLGMLLVGASLAMAVVLGLVFGLALIAYEALRPKPENAANPEEVPFEDLPPEKIGDLAIAGFWYLTCMDVVALPFPSLYRLIGEETQEEGAFDDENWKPSMTTIPFGPYLAAGAIACMLFANPISGEITTWWLNSTGRPAGGTTSRIESERFASNFSLDSYGKATELDKVEPRCFLLSCEKYGA
jgi:leader peptidase (prepilin peptidase)/N-methyltransferase